MKEFHCLKKVHTAVLVWKMQYLRCFYLMCDSSFFSYFKWEYFKTNFVVVVAFLRKLKSSAIHSGSLQRVFVCFFGKEASATAMILLCNRNRNVHQNHFLYTIIVDFVHRNNWYFPYPKCYSEKLPFFLYLIRLLEWKTWYFPYTKCGGTRKNFLIRSMVEKIFVKN